MKDTGERFALVALPPRRRGGLVCVIAISEDAIPAAEARKWIVVARDSDVVDNKEGVDR